MIQMAAGDTTACSTREGDPAMPRRSQCQPQTVCVG